VQREIHDSRTYETLQKVRELKQQISQVQAENAKVKMHATTKKLHELWRKKPLQFLPQVERDLILNHDMFEGLKVSPDDIETLE
jgi:hypothetical protein